jgi:hypothetical protein
MLVFFLASAFVLLVLVTIRAFTPPKILSDDVGSSIAVNSEIRPPSTQPLCVCEDCGGKKLDIKRGLPKSLTKRYPGPRNSPERRKHLR